MSEATVRAVMEATASAYGLPSGHLTAKTRRAHIALPRHVAMYLARELTNHSLPRLGEAFGRDHTTVFHGVRRVADRLIAGDNELKAKVDAIRARVAAGDPGPACLREEKPARAEYRASVEALTDGQRALYHKLRSVVGRAAAFREAQRPVAQ